jgi:hypothetical protein
MRQRVKSFSILMLLVFGVNLIAEIASAHSESLQTHSSISAVSSFDSDSGGYQNEESTPQGVNTEHKGCTDPCHRGQCHFGHCAYHAVSGYAAISPALLSKGHIALNFLAPKAPFLDGPKRPPRLS